MVLLKLGAGSKNIYIFLTSFKGAIYQSNEFYSNLTHEQKMEISNHGYVNAPPGKSCKGYVGKFFLTGYFFCISLYLISILEPGLEGSYPKDGVTDVRWLSEQLINQKLENGGAKWTGYVVHPKVVHG